MVFMTRVAKRKRIKVLCRLSHVMNAPCNWVVQGRCGEDSKPCRIIKVVRK